MSQTKIIEEELVYTEEDIYSMKFNSIFLENVFRCFETQSIFLARMKLIANVINCQICARCPEMKYVQRKSSIDGYVWICKRPCNSSKSLRTSSCFYDCKLKMKIVFNILRKYMKGETHDNIAFDLQVNRETVRKYGDFARDAICDFVTNNNEKIGGIDEFGLPRIVEIDESLFFRRKYNKGRATDGQWYVGGIERGSKKAFLVPVSNRNSQTMLQVIKQNVLPGTTIITDEWRAYSAALRNDSNFLHKTVNHSYNFVNPIDMYTHTQNIEGFWSLSKRFLRGRHGINRDQHFEYLLQFLWEFKIEKNKRLNKLLILLQIKN